MQHTTLAVQWLYTDLQETPQTRPVPAQVRAVFLKKTGVDVEGRHLTHHEVAADVWTAARHYVMPSYLTYPNFHEDVAYDNESRLELMEYIQDAGLVQLAMGLGAWKCGARFTQTRSAPTCEEWMEMRGKGS